MSKQKIKLFTHTDLDGVGCAILANVFFNHFKNDNLSIEYCNYNNVDDKVNKFIDYDSVTQVIITDISINEDTAARLNKRGSVKLFDHHQTALWLNKYDWSTVIVEQDGVKESGTSIFFKWLRDNADITAHGLIVTSMLFDFVRYVKNYDTWKWVELGEKGVISKNLHDLLGIYGIDNFFYIMTMRLLSGENVFISESDNQLLQYLESETERYINKKNSELICHQILGYNVGVVFADRFINEIGSELGKMHPEVDFIAIVDLGKKTVSYRTTKNNINLGTSVASVYGGGGHDKAAGSQINEDVQKEIMQKIFSQK